MSAYIVPREHIALLVEVARIGPRRHEVAPGTAWYGPRWSGPDGLDPNVDDRTGSADRIGTMLTAENVRSVAYRYPGETRLPGTYPNGEGDWIAPYVHDPYRRRIGQPSAVQVLKAIGCYEYQSCESPDWEQSEAFAFCDALRRSLIHCLDGYDAAPWSWEAEEVATLAR